jgi:hypothetical protein
MTLRRIALAAVLLLAPSLAFAAEGSPSQPPAPPPAAAAPYAPVILDESTFKNLIEWISSNVPAKWGNPLTNSFEGLERAAQQQVAEAQRKAFDEAKKKAVDESAKPATPPVPAQKPERPGKE